MNNYTKGVNRNYHSLQHQSQMVVCIKISLQVLLFLNISRKEPENSCKASKADSKDGKEHKEMYEQLHQRGEQELSFTSASKPDGCVYQDITTSPSFSQHI